jgi:hypothetical protein
VDDADAFGDAATEEEGESSDIDAQTGDRSESGEQEGP